MAAREQPGIARRGEADRAAAGAADWRGSTPAR